MKNFEQLLPKQKIVDFCHQWEIEEMYIFGSALRDDFGPESDIDLMVTFTSDAEWSLFDHVKMQNDLEKLLERSVDLVTKKAIERSHNWIRRNEILNTAQLYFSANEAIRATG